jgi:hypothetical protein
LAGFCIVYAYCYYFCWAVGELELLAVFYADGEGADFGVVVVVFCDVGDNVISNRLG